MLVVYSICSWRLTFRVGPKAHESESRLRAVGTVVRPAATPGVVPLPGRHAADLGHHFGIARRRARRPRASPPLPAGDTVDVRNASALHRVPCTQWLCALNEISLAALTDMH